MLAIIVLITSISMLPVFADGITKDNFDAFTLPTSGAYQNTNKVCIRGGQLSQFPFTIETGVNDQFNGCYLNGTATNNSTSAVINFENVQVTDSGWHSGGVDYELYFAAKAELIPSGSFTFDLTISREQKEITTTPDEGGDDETGGSDITKDNFEPFKLPTSRAYQNTNKVCIRGDQLSQFPFTIETGVNDQFNGCYLNGTATNNSTSAVINFENVQVTDSGWHSGGVDYELYFAAKADLVPSGSFTFDLTISRTAQGSTGGGDGETGDSDITIDNFEPFKLPTTGAFNSPTKVVIAEDQLSKIPFTLNEADLLKGCYLNGTATKADSTVVAFEDVEITSSAVRSAGGYELYFAQKADLGYDNHTWDLTLSRTPLGTGGGDDGGDDEPDTPTVFDPYNFTSFKLTVTADGAAGLRRLVVSASNFPVPLTLDNQLVGCLLNGTATPTATGIANGHTETIVFEDVMVERSSVRSGATEYNVDFTAFGGLQNASGGYYTYDLTLSPKPAPSVDFPDDSSTFFIHPDQFSKTGNWTTETESGKYVLFGTASILGTASALVVIPEDGTYTVKGYARDYLNDSATNRYMDVEINGVKGERIGDHDTAGYVWETIGTYEFKKGDEVLVEVTKAGLYARLAGICFSTASDYTPDDAHMEENFNKASATLAFLPLDETKINMLVLPEDFNTDLGTWTLATDGGRDILSGITSGSAKEATASINIETGGIYYIWGYSKDDSTEGQGTRSMKFGVNGTILDGEIGVFGETTQTDEGGSYGWDYAGKVWLSKDSKMMISLMDTSANGAKFAAAMITSDANFKGISEKNFPTYAGNSAFRASVNKEIIDISGINSYGNKLSFTLKNRTANKIEEGTLIYAVYTKSGRLADVAYTTFEDLDAYSGLEKTEHIFSSTESWTKGKIMLWDGFDTMKALCEVQNFTFSEEDKTNPDENAGGDFGTVTDYDIDYVFRNQEYEAKEFNIRGGMKNTIAKLEKGEAVTVAYIGGSITEGETWRPLTTAWLKQQYPDANITEVKVAMSGTGADLAACRLDEEILAYNPDLLFVEYAANSGTEKDVEGIARKLWEHDATADICIVYVSQTPYFGLYQNGQMPEIPTAFEKVANHLNIPSIFFVYHPLDLYENDELTLTGKEEGKVLYTTDTIHMTKDGGYLAASAIARCILKQAESLDVNTYQITNHEVPEDYTLGGTYYPWSEASSSDDWSKMKFTGTWLDCSKDASGNLKNFTHSGGSAAFSLFDNMIGTKTAGSSITIKFKGTDIGIFEAGGQYSGQVKVTIDGVEQANSWQLYDANYDSKLRYQYNFYKSLPDGVHTVTFTLDSTMPDKSGLRSKYPSDSTYDLNELYIGRILLNGELLDANE